MKAPNFAYLKPDSLAQAFEALERYGEDARILAGGQSLLPALNLRLSAPRVLIDITGLRELKGISIENGTVRIGALTRHCELERSPEIAAKASLLKQAIAHVGHPAVRNRGTCGGSIAFADPAAELPACAVALDAEIVAVSVAGERRIRAEQFFTGLYETALEPNELISAIEFRADDSSSRATCEEIARRHGDFAVIGIAARARVTQGVLSDVRLVYFGAVSTPTLAPAAAAAVEGRALTPCSIEEAQQAVLADLDPNADLYHSAQTKAHYARVLLKRTLERLAGSAK